MGDPSFLANLAAHLHAKLSKDQTSSFLFLVFANCRVYVGIPNPDFYTKAKNKCISDPPKRSNVLKKIKRKVFNKYILPAVYFHRAPSPYWHRPSSWAPSRRFAGRGIGSPCVTRPPHSTHRLSSLSEIPIFISFAGSRLFQKEKLTTKGVANLLFGQVSLKTVWTWRKLDRGGAGDGKRPASQILLLWTATGSGPCDEKMTVVAQNDRFRNVFKIFTYLSCFVQTMTVLLRTLEFF